MVEGRTSLGGDPDSLLSTAIEDAPSDLLSSAAGIIAATRPLQSGAQALSMHERAHAETKQAVTCQLAGA
jgi:hypothetical protein